jgi:stress-induced morphogen
MMEAEDIVSMIRESLPDAWVEVEDLRGNGIHYMAYVESAAFVGKAIVDQHRLVFEALRGHMGSSIGTLTLKTSLPPEYKLA